MRDYEVGTTAHVNATKAAMKVMANKAACSGAVKSALSGAVNQVAALKPSCLPTNSTSLCMTSYTCIDGTR